MRVSLEGSRSWGPRDGRLAGPGCWRIARRIGGAVIVGYFGVEGGEVLAHHLGQRIDRLHLLLVRTPHIRNALHEPLLEPSGFSLVS